MPPYMTAGGLVGVNVSYVAQRGTPAWEQAVWYRHIPQVGWGMTQRWLCTVSSGRSTMSFAASRCAKRRVWDCCHAEALCGDAILHNDIHHYLVCAPSAAHDWA